MKLLKNSEMQENQFILSFVNREEWTLLETHKKYAIGAMYYQIIMKQLDLTVIDIKNSHIPPANL